MCVKGQCGMDNWQLLAGKPQVEVGTMIKKACPMRLVAAATVRRSCLHINTSRHIFLKTTALRAEASTGNWWLGAYSLTKTAHQAV
jgi:hypothetical protein